MKPHSLVLRLTVVQLLLAAAIMLVLALSAIALSSRALEREESTVLARASKQMVDGLEREYAEEKDFTRAANSALEEDAPPGIRVEIFDAAGRLAASTSRRLLPEVPGEMRRLEARAVLGGWIVTTISTRPRRHALATLAMALLLAGLLLLVLLSWVSGVVARRALRPLSRITRQVEQAGVHGTLAPLALPSDPHEVGVLAQSFQRLLASLEQALERERHFTRDAAHELKTPLTVLSGELEYALADAALPARHRDGLTHAWEQVGAMSELVEALLLLQRADSESADRHKDFAPVNLADLVRELSSEIRARAPQRERDLSVDAEDEVLVAGHAVLLSAALRNLVENALKFTEPGQAVTIHARENDGQASVVVDDAGLGLPLDERERIFDPFYRAAEARATQEGFGLGLPILRRVARAHGGDVLVGASALGGARFELQLPLWSPADSA